jgi:hypothetical protein
MNTKKKCWILRKQAASKPFINLKKKYFLTTIITERGGKN